jgi:hypothetical protein
MVYLKHRNIEKIRFYRTNSVELGSVRYSSKVLEFHCSGGTIRLFFESFFSIYKKKKHSFDKLGLISVKLSVLNVDRILLVLDTLLDTLVLVSIPEVIQLLMYGCT